MEYYIKETPFSLSQYSGMSKDTVTRLLTEQNKVFEFITREQYQKELKEYEENFKKSTLGDK